MEERCLFFFLFQWRESVRRGARRGALGVPRSVWYKVGCVFWVAESGGACAGGGTRRGESGRSNQHKEERVRVEERENTHDCVRCCDCELCEGGVHLLSPVCVACPVSVSMVPVVRNMGGARDGVGAQVLTSRRPTFARARSAAHLTATR